MKKMMLILAVVMCVMAGSAMAAAGTLVFSVDTYGVISAETWDTWDGTGTAVMGTDGSSGWADQQNPAEAWSQYAAIAIDKTFSVGDVVSFNLTVSAPELVVGDPDNSNTWLGQLYAGFTNAPIDFSGGFAISTEYGFDHWANWDLPAAGISIDVSYEFISATEARLIVNEVTGTPVNWQDQIVALSVGNITGFYTGTWNTQQTYTISEVTVTAAIMIPTPGNREIDVPVDQVLSWTAYSDPDLISVNYDVYVDPNETKVISGTGCEYSNTGQAGTTFDPSSDLDSLTTYYWRVQINGTYDPETSDPDSAVWSFTTISLEPIIETLDNVITVDTFMPVDLSAVVSDADGDLAGLTWTLLTDDFHYPAGAIASVSDTTSELYAPTAEFTTDTAGIYMVELAVWDISTIVTRMVYIDVQTDACVAAALDPAFGGYNYYDVDGNCIVDLSDFAAFALQWTDDISITDQIPGLGFIPVHLPTHYGLVNGNFEAGDVVGGYGDLALGWWSLGTVEITDVGADVYEGTYSAKFTDDAALNTLVDFYNLPAGNHSIMFRYKGDLSEVTIDLKGSMGEDLAPTDGSEVALVNSTETGFEDYWVVENAPMVTYAQYEVRFTVTTEGVGDFKIQSTITGGTGFFDDFRLVLDSH